MSSVANDVVAKSKIVEGAVIGVVVSLIVTVATVVVQLKVIIPVHREKLETMESKLELVERRLYTLTLMVVSAPRSDIDRSRLLAPPPAEPRDPVPTSHHIRMVGILNPRRVV